MCMKKYLLSLLITTTVFLPAISFANDVYTITVYHFKDAQQEVVLDTYLQTAYLPALHRKNKNAIGVFKPIANDTAADKIIYVIVPFKSLAEIQSFDKSLAGDSTYLLAGKDYLNASYQTPP